MVNMTTGSLKPSVSSIKDYFEDNLLQEKKEDTQSSSFALAIDRFEARGTLSPCEQPDLLENITFYTHFLLEQQKCANLQIASSNDLIDRVLNSKEISNFLSAYPALKKDLEAFEKVKKWESQDRTVHLKSNEDFILSLLKLLLDKEDVHLIQWLDVSLEHYEKYKTKILNIEKEKEKKEKELQQMQASLKSLEDQLVKPNIEKQSPLLKSKATRTREDILNQQNLIKIDQMRLEIMQKKGDIFKYILTSSNNKKPLDYLQDIMRSQIAPAINREKSWIIFGKRCLELATELNTTAKRYHNINSQPQKEQLKKTLLGLLKIIDVELSKNKGLLKIKPPDY